jgi:glucan phosphorylase
MEKAAKIRENKGTFGLDFQQRKHKGKPMSDPRSIAYFSMEIALEPGMPTYSGGLGILVGDTQRMLQQYVLNAYFR